jgi:hypothetical protein
MIPWLPADNANYCKPEIALHCFSRSHDGESGPARSELARNCESKSDCVMFVDFTYLVADTGLMTGGPTQYNNQHPQCYNEFSITFC